MLNIFDAFSEFIKEVMVLSMVDIFSDYIDQINATVSWASGELGATPVEFAPEIFNLLRTLSETVIVPIAGIILTFICTWELIQMLIEHNHMADVDFWMIFKWILKTYVAVLLITNCFNITWAVFDVAQYVISSSGRVINVSTALDGSLLASMEASLREMSIGSLIGLFFQSIIVKVTMMALSICTFVIIYGRMIEIYLMTSLAPIPFSTFGNREQSHIGQNYLRSLIALGLQGFLIMVCFGIYAILVQSIAVSDDIFSTIWGILGYTVLLVFTLFKTSSLAKSIVSAH